MSERILPPDGDYVARRTGKMKVSNSSTGGVIVAIPYALVETEHNYRGTHFETVVTGDGTIREKSVQTLMSIFGWDGLDFATLNDIEPNEGDGAEFAFASCKQETYVPNRENAEPTLTFKTGWLNTLDGGGSNLEPADRKELATKWSAKLRALHGGTKSQPPATAKPAAKPQPAKPAPTKPAQAGPPSRRAGSPPAGGHPRSSSFQEVWDALAKANPGVDDAQLGDKFYAAQDEVRAGADSKMTPAEWGQVLTILGL